MPKNKSVKKQSQEFKINKTTIEGACKKIVFEDQQYKDQAPNLKKYTKHLYTGNQEKMDKLKSADELKKFIKDNLKKHSLEAFIKSMEAKPETISPTTVTEDHPETPFALTEKKPNVKSHRTLMEQYMVLAVVASIYYVLNRPTKREITSSDLLRDPHDVKSSSGLDALTILKNNFHIPQESLDAIPQGSLGAVPKILTTKQIQALIQSATGMTPDLKLLAPLKETLENEIRKINDGDVTHIVLSYVRDGNPHV